MKLKKSSLFFLFVIIFVIIIILISVSLIRRGSRNPHAGYFSTKCLDYKQKEYSRKLNDKIVDYSAAARLNGIRVSRKESW
jgi:hypothetical protein